MTYIDKSVIIEMHEIKWLPLRLNTLPLIDRQVTAVSEIYRFLREEILRGDILAIEHLNLLIQSAQHN